MVVSKTSAAFFGVGTEEHRHRRRHRRGHYHGLQETSYDYSHAQSTSLESWPALSDAVREAQTFSTAKPTRNHEVR